jgi:Tfp pilus assembly protein PilF
MLQQNDLKKALVIFEMNVKKYPDSWNVYDSFAEALAKSGDREKAIKNYSVALSKSPENQKQRIQKAIDNLK